MKTQFLILQALLLASMAVLGIGCAKKHSGASATIVGSTPTPNPSGTPTTSGPVPSYSTGDTVAFYPENQQNLTEYVGAPHPLNAPKNFRINVDLSNIGNGRYAGTVQMGYYDNGQSFNGKFESGTGYAGQHNGGAVYSQQDKNKPESEFNQWFTWENKQVFHGFFSDNQGAVILVIDGGLDLGDGGGMTDMDGSLWFKNFGTGYASASSEKCWFVWIGPYACRTFKVGDEVVTNSALYPKASDGYKKLGSFWGLKRAKAIRN